MRLLSSLGIGALLSLTSPVLAAPKPCSVLWGVNRFEEPLIKTPEMAKALFLTLEKHVNPGKESPDFPFVEVHDQEDYWIVGRVQRYTPGLPPIEGGGQLSLKIAKCDGAIAGVFLSR